MDSIEKKWREEVSLGHRWGREWSERFTSGLPQELEELNSLWESASPLDEPDSKILDQILALEVCNWDLFGGILDLTKAIGNHQPIERRIGHGALTPERWKKVWAYYLGLQDYVWGSPQRDAFVVLLDAVDSDQTIRNKIEEYLGERTELKVLLAQRLLYAMNWTVSHFPWDSTWTKAQNAGIEVLDERILELGGDEAIIRHLKWPVVDGRLQPCSHKFFRRLDIIISSIGSGNWRGRIPFRGTDGLELSRKLDTYLAPITAWVEGNDDLSSNLDNEPGISILRNLGEPNPAKRFLAKLLHSLLKCQQIAAQIKGEERC